MVFAPFSRPPGTFSRIERLHGPRLFGLYSSTTRFAEYFIADISFSTVLFSPACLAQKTVCISTNCSSCPGVRFYQELTNCRATSLYQLDGLSTELREEPLLLFQLFSKCPIWGLGTEENRYRRLSLFDLMALLPRASPGSLPGPLFWGRFEPVKFPCQLVPPSLRRPFCCTSMDTCDYFLQVELDDIIHFFKVTGASVGLTEACVTIIQVCLRKSDSI